MSAAEKTHNTTAPFVTSLFVVAVAAMLLGMALAWTQLAGDWGGQLPNSAAAKVAEQIIPKAEVQRAINGANTTRRETLTAEQEQQVLNRLIDEQLLLQYGLDLGLVYNNPTVRKPLVQAVMGLVRANAQSIALDDAALEKWYTDNSERFAHGGQRQLHYFRVQKNQLTEGELKANANSLVALLQSGAEPSAQQLSQWQTQRVSYLPNTLLPRNKLRDYLGQSLVEAAMALPAGGVSSPLAINNGLAVLKVVQAVDAGEPVFAEIKEQVQNAMRRELGEQALRDLLADLREDYDVMVADDWR